MAPRVDQLGLDDGKELQILMRRFYPLLLEQAWEDAEDELAFDLAFDLDNPYVQDILDELAGNIKGICYTTKDEIRALIGRQADEGWGLDELADQIATLGEGHSQSRAMMIARTETASAYTKGSLSYYQESGVVASVEWLATDPCDICVDLAGMVVPLGEEFAEGISGPPAHPGCRCAVAPIVS